MITLTEHGRKTISEYVKNSKSKQEQLLQDGIDTADQQRCPTRHEILEDLKAHESEIKKGVYAKTWPITDNYYNAAPLVLIRGVDFSKTPEVSPMLVTDIEWDHPYDTSSLEGYHQIPTEVEISSNTDPEDVPDALSAWVFPRDARALSFTLPKSADYKEITLTDAGLDKVHRYALALESEKEKWHLLDKDTAEHVKACSELAVLQGIADFEKSCVVHGGLNGWYDETWKASDHAMAMRSLRLHRGEDYFEPTKRGSMLVFGIKWDVYTEEGASNPILPQETEIPDDIPADKAAAYLTQKAGYRVIDCKVCRFR